MLVPLWKTKPHLSFPDGVYGSEKVDSGEEEGTEDLPTHAGVGGMLP